MNTWNVCRQDLRAVRRTNVLWAVLLCYIGFSSLVVGSAAYAADGLGVAQTFRILALLGLLVLPITALVAGYLAIAGEREEGTICILLGLPTTRAEVLLGKFLSRLAVVELAIVCSFVVATGLFIFAGVPIDFTLVIITALLTALFTASYVAIAIGISALTASRSQAMTGSIGVFLVCNVLWTFFSPYPIPDLIKYALTEQVGLSPSPALFEFISALSPATAYLRALRLAGSQVTPVPATPSTSLSAELMVAILGAWVVIPLSIGYYRFRHAELTA